MDFPVILACGALLIWGFTSDLMGLGCALAIPSALAIFKNFPQKVQESQLRPLTEFCFVALLIGFFVINNNVEKSRDSLFLIFKFAPLFFYPVALCRFIGGIKMASLQTLFLPLRYRQVDIFNIGKEQLDFAWLYSFLLLLSASSKNELNSTLYFPLCALWIVLAMAFCLPIKGSSMTRWTALLMSLSVGYGLQWSLHRGEMFMEQQGRDWIQNQIYNDGLLAQSTMIGQTATLQSSEKILLRYKSQQLSNEPIYLRSSAFDVFVGQDTWMSSENLLTLKDSKNDWIPRQADTPVALSPVDKIQDSLLTNLPGAWEAEMWLETHGQSWLPLPESVVAIRVPLCEPFQRLGYNSIRLTSKSKTLHIQLKSSPAPKNPPPPGLQYLNIFENHAKIMEAFVEKNHLQTQVSLQELLQQIHLIFSSFKYSLELHASNKDQDALEQFLMTSHQGHCEYFATATVLLLRYCGYPARYCSGFVCKEQLGPWHIARGQDAHAWAEVWDGYGWKIVENTPATELPISIFRPLKNLWSNFMFWIDVWRYQGGEDRLLNNAPWLLVLVLLYFSYRLVQEWQKNKKKTPLGSQLLQSHRPDPGFIYFEAHMTEIGYPRKSNETWQAWQARLKSETLESLISDEQVELWNEWHWGKSVIDETKIHLVLKKIQ